MKKLKITKKFKVFLLRGLVLVTVFIAIGIASAQTFTTWDTGEAPQAAPGEGNVELNLSSGGVTQEWVQSYVAANAPSPKGYKQRANFSYYDADEITLNPAVYELNGKMVNWDSEMNYQLTSMSTNTWYYIYLDDSEISTSGVIDNTKLTHSSTAPTFDGSKHGWYNGDDRCIFAVRSDASSNLIIFHHDGSDSIFFDSVFNSGGLSTTSTAWYTYTLDIPDFSTQAFLSFSQKTYLWGDNNLTYRPKGSSGGLGVLNAPSNRYATSTKGNDPFRTNVRVTTSAVAPHQIEMHQGKTTTSATSFQLHGFVLPTGI